MIYQLGWTTLPGLRGLSVSEFRAAPTAAPDNESGVAVEFAGSIHCGEFLRQLEKHFAARGFSNSADPFDTEKTAFLEHRADARGNSETSSGHGGTSKQHR